MKIKEILDEIAALSGKIEKRETLAKYKDNEVLKKVIYAAHSPRIKFYIKKIPTYTACGEKGLVGINEVLDDLGPITSRSIRGNDAIKYLTTLFEALSDDDAYVLERIINKNLKIGMDSGYNDVIPGLIEETPYQGAVSFSEKKARKLFDNLGEDEYVMSQIKADGTYRNAETGNSVILTSRQGEVSHLRGAKFLEELKELEDFVLNGELTIDGKDRYEANGMVSSMMDIIEKEAERDDKTNAKKLEKFEKSHGSFEEALQKLRFTVWDVLSYEEFAQKKSDMEYGDRFGGLEDLLWSINPTMISVVETRYIKTYAEAIEHFLDAQARGLEGTIIKSASAGWKDGKPTYQIKMKLEMNMDLRVVKPVYGTEGKKYEGLINGFELESSCGTIKTTARGVKEAEMKIFTEEGDNLIGEIMEVRCCGLSQNSDGEWSLLHPSVVEWRKDKNTCDDFNSCKEIEEMAKGLKDLVEK
jgi:hypothetical protein